MEVQVVRVGETVIDGIENISFALLPFDKEIL